ncbi:MAG TPA: hypothetical protein VK420_11980 [Longimicrobium sp.]|jgi:hypothetical protein|nr:hypothetical protein [Longimicrobium sp.]
MTERAALLAFLCVLAACGPGPQEDPRTSDAESAPSTALPAPPVVSPSTGDDAPADSNTTSPAATLEEAAPPPEP